MAGPICRRNQLALRGEDDRIHGRTCGGTRQTISDSGTFQARYTLEHLAEDQYIVSIVLPAFWLRDPHKDGLHIFYAPALPLMDVFDPTGAGDTFAGGMVGYLAYTKDVSFENLKCAIHLWVGHGLLICGELIYPKTAGIKCQFNPG